MQTLVAPGPIVIIDDDIELITELRHGLSRRSDSGPLVGPPQLLFETAELWNAVASARVVILDLNIGGSITYGRVLLKRIRRKAPEIPVVVWTKYLTKTILFESGRPVWIDHEAGNSARPIADTEVAELVHDLGEIHSGVRGFVTKLVADPIGHLCGMLERLKLIGLTNSKA